MNDKNTVKELKAMLAEDFHNDEDYDNLRRDIIAEINASSRTLEEKEFETIAKKQRLESRTTLSDTSLALSYVALILSVYVMMDVDFGTEPLLYFILIIDLILAGILVFTRLFLRTKHNKAILYYTVKLNCINQIRRERNLNTDKKHQTIA